MNGLLEQLDASIEALMPPDQAAAWREARQQDERNRAQLRRTVKHECFEAIEYASLAGRSLDPMTDIQAAIEHLQAAERAARELER